jgi:hypothetical protein
MLQTMLLRAGGLSHFYVARFDDGDFGIKRNGQTQRHWPVRIALSQHIGSQRLGSLQQIDAAKHR